MTEIEVPTLGRESDFVPSAAARDAEMRSYRAFVGLLGRPVRQPAVGAAVPVVLVPGFISGDVSLTILARHLRRAGHRTFGSRIGANLGCTDAMVARLIGRLEDVVAAEGRRVAVVGHSRGGMVVKLAAQRRPDLVEGIVLLAAPVTGTLRVAAHVRAQLELLFRLNRHGVGAVMSEDCVTGECATRIAAELVEPLPAQVAYTSVYSEADAIIDWRTCLDPAAECIAVGASHTGMGTDPLVREIVVSHLARLVTRSAADAVATSP